MNILMLAYYFPPDSSSGSFRPLYFASYFKKKGDRVTILTAKKEYFLPDQSLDPPLLPNDLNITRTRVYRPREALLGFRDRIFKRKGHSLGMSSMDPVGDKGKVQTVFQVTKDFITTALASPDAHMGWLFPGILAGRRLLKTQKFDIIYATGSPWTGMLIGSVLKYLFKVPLVLDFRDPWTQNPGFMIRQKVFRILESAMEKTIVKQADCIIANTEELACDFKTRYNICSEKIIAIPNGYEKTYPSVASLNEKFTLTHAGSLYFSRNPKNLLQAIKNLLDKGLIPQDQIRVNFIGGIGINDSDLDTLLADHQLERIIHTTPRVSFDRACDYQLNSDVLFLIQPDFPLQVPRKLYESMAFGKPVLGITNRTGATAAIIRETGIGEVVENRVEDIQQAVIIFFKHWQSNRLDKEYAGSIDKYSNQNLSGQLRKYLVRVIETHG